VIIAFGILILFISFWYHALFQINFTKTYWFDIMGTFFILEFLYTGLFIICHDAIHGSISYRVSSILRN
jgi:fatty acid desaturase